MSAVITPFPMSRLARSTHAAQATEVFERERLVHRRVHQKHVLHRAGQPARAAFFVHAGAFKTSVLDSHGQERVVGFPMKGDLLGAEALAGGVYVSDVVALDVADVIELPVHVLFDQTRAVLPVVAAALSTALQRDWAWMLALRVYDAEQRVVRFLLDYANRMRMLGYSPDKLVLRMTRADIGSFLDLAAESVVRSMSRLEAARLVEVCCREINILDSSALEEMLARDVCTRH